MISVAMATYNSTRYIEKQLDSITKQSTKIDEIVIQDDCSVDTTVELIKEFFKDKEIKVSISVNEKNLGYIKTFKKAIAKCSGDIIILCDHDDIWLEDKVNIIKNAFDTNDNILALATSFVEIDADDNIIKTKNKLFHANNNLIRHRIKKNQLNKMTFKDVATFNISPGCTCAFKSDIKKELLEYDSCLPHDLQIMIISALNDGLFYLDKVTTKYRIYSNNTIGLGHQTDIHKRIKNVEDNYNQKQDIKTIIEKYGYSKKDNHLIDRIIFVFKNRIKLMKTRKIIRHGINTLVLSIGLNKMYESIVVDIYTILKSKSGE